MTEKDRILGVDYADDVEAWYLRGELGDSRLIEQIMDNAVKAGMTHVAWRVSHVGTLTYHTKAGTMCDGHHELRPTLTPFGLIMQRCDPLEVAVRVAHERGLKILFYITLFDECRAVDSNGVPNILYTGVPPQGQCLATSPDGMMSWEKHPDNPVIQEPNGPVSESWLGRQHPEYYSRHFSENLYVRGVFSLGYPEVKQYFHAILREGLDYGCDGLYLDVARTASGANPIPVHGWWPQWTNPYLAYGYNEPDVARYRERYGEAAPIPHWTSTNPLEPTEKEKNWNRIRGEALTDFVREVRPLAQSYDASVDLCFFPTTYNGFNPGYHCRQMLGRYYVDWETMVDEGLIDGIRLNVDHRRFGYDDWVAHSADTYKWAQDRGVNVYIDCAIEGRYDQLESPPQPLPISREEDPGAYFELMGTMVRKMLDTSADGLVYYEHCGNDDRTWKTLRAAHEDG